MAHASAGVVGVSLVALLSAPAQAQNMTLGEVLVFRPSGTRPQADSTGHVLQADRGSRKGQYVVVSATADGAA
ncbi:MAG: hypothetical protein ACRD15_13900, partial [Vicinamibacterales bacterium]